MPVDGGVSAGGDLYGQGHDDTSHGATVDGVVQVASGHGGSPLVGASKCLPSPWQHPLILPQEAPLTQL